MCMFFMTFLISGYEHDTNSTCVDFNISNGQGSICRGVGRGVNPPLVPLNPTKK